MKLRHLCIASLAIALLGTASTASVFAAKPARKKTKTTKTTKSANTETPKAEDELVEPFVADPPKAIEEQQGEMWYYYGETPVGSSWDIIEAKPVVKEVPIERPAPPSPPAAPVPVDDNKVFDSVEQDPIFPGGQVALLEYVASHIKYPKKAMKNGIQGRVRVQFVVKKDGSIGQVKVLRSKDPDLDKEDVSVIKSLPKFTPGKMNGHAVNVWYTLPVTFKLSN